MERQRAGIACILGVCARCFFFLVFFVLVRLRPTAPDSCGRRPSSAAVSRPSGPFSRAARLSRLFFARSPRVASPRGAHRALRWRISRLSLRCSRPSSRGSRTTTRRRPARLGTSNSRARRGAAARRRQRSERRRRLWVKPRPTSPLPPRLVDLKDLQLFLCLQRGARAFLLRPRAILPLLPRLLRLVGLGRSFRRRRRGSRAALRRRGPPRRARDHRATELAELARCRSSSVACWIRSLRLRSLLLVGRPGAPLPPRVPLRRSPLPLRSLLPHFPLRSPLPHFPLPSLLLRLLLLLVRWLPFAKAAGSGGWIRRCSSGLRTTTVCLWAIWAPR